MSSTIPSLAVSIRAVRAQSRSVTPGRVCRAMLLTLAALAISGGVAHAQYANFVATDSAITVPTEGNVLIHGIRAQDEIVLVNVRPLGSCCEPGLLEARLRVETYVASDESGRRRWMPADLESVLGADPGVATLIFVHGNQLTAWDAKHEGLSVYRRMVYQSPTAAPIRFVIFSWPSAQIRGPLKDARAKAARTGPAGCQLAWFVDQLPAETPVTLVGFSFGARIITGALHILGGGSLGRHGLAELQHPNRMPMNVVLIAAALHADWLYPGRYHGQAMTQVDQMLLLNNCEDPAMRYYRFVSQGGRPKALGCRGPTCIDAEGASKITQRSVSCYVGNNHNLFCYLSTPGVIGQIWEYAGHAPAAVAGL